MKGKWLNLHTDLAVLCTSISVGVNGWGKKAPRFKWITPRGLMKITLYNSRRWVHLDIQFQILF